VEIQVGGNECTPLRVGHQLAGGESVNASVSKNNCCAAGAEVINRS